MGRSPRAPALAAALVLVALVGPAAAVSSVFTALGNSFVVSTPEWTLMSPFSQNGGGTGVFYNATSIFTFTAPKNRGPRSRDGTTVKSTTTMRFNKVTLTPVTVTASSGLQPIPGAVGPVLRRLRIRLPKGSLVPQTTGVTFVPQGTAFPYSVLYGGPSQTSATLLTPNTGAKILGKPQLKYGKDKPIQISTSSPTFQLATAGTASALCANGYGGAVGTAVSGCAQCKAGSFASGFDQSTPCQACSSVSSNSISSQAGASSCSNCTAGTTPNANNTACVGGGSVNPVSTSFSMIAPGPCSAATAAQIKASQEAFLLSQPGVQSVTVTVTCTAAARRRALLQANVVYTSTVNCTATTTTSQCSAAFTALGAQVVSCCTVPKPATCTNSTVTPANCTGTTTGTACAANFYVANGVCVACGAGATSPGGFVTNCTCTNGGTWSASTGCPTGVNCVAGTYFNANASACAVCPANSYCTGGIGSAAVATPCPGTMSTNGLTAQTSVLACAQGNSFLSATSDAAQSWTSISSWGGLPIGAGLPLAPEDGEVRIAAAANGRLYGSVDGGVSWTATGPDSENRTWTSVSTCQYAVGAASTQADRAIAIVAAADNGGIWVAVGTDISAGYNLPAQGKWIKITGGIGAGGEGPDDTLAYTSVACAAPVAVVGGNDVARLFVIASTGGSSGQLWVAAAPVLAATATPTAVTFEWAQVSLSAPLANGDFTSVAAAVAGRQDTAADAQGVAFAAARKGSAGRLYTGVVFAANVDAFSVDPALTAFGGVGVWTDRTSQIVVDGVEQRNYVSVDIGTLGGVGDNADELPLAVAIGNGRIAKSTTATAGTWTFVSVDSQPWASVDLNFDGTAVAAAASVGGIWYSGTLAGDSLRKTTITPVPTQTNQISGSQAWTDVALIGAAPTGVICATLPGFGGFGIQQGDLTGTTTFTWTNAAASTSRDWVDIATSASGVRVVAITPTDVYISNTNGSSWSKSVFTRPALSTLASVSIDSTGNIIAVLDTSVDRVFTSTDGGRTWSSGGAQLLNAGTPATNALSVSINAEGTRIYAATGTGGTADGFIYVSTNNGQTFAPVSTVEQRNWAFIDAGAGLNLVASTTGGTVYNSIDGGVTTAAQNTGLTGSKTYKVQTSANGAVLVAMDFTGGAGGTDLFITTCSGTACAPWTRIGTNNNPPNFPATDLQAVSLSDDASRLFVVSSAASQGIWTGTATTTAGTYTWLGPKVAGQDGTSIPGLASSANGGYVYGASDSAIGGGGVVGQIWLGFGST